MNRVLVFGGGDLVPGQNCLSDEDLALLASSKTAGINPMLDHVAGCDWCGERLRLLVQVSQTELTREEELVLSRVTALREPRQSRRTRPAWRWLAAFAAAAAVSVAVAFLWNARTSGPERTGAMLAQAYGQNRVIELRVSDAEYGPLRKERGAGSPLDKPAALLNAEARIREALESNPDDVEWLRLKGRAQLLEQEPDEAVKTLTLANTKAPRDVRVLADLGIAYAERSAATTAGADDSGRAIEFLERAKQISPKNLDVIFNLALVYERQNMFSMASLCWKEYLELDAVSPWADEARVHLKNLESKRAGVQTRRNLPRTPQAFLAQLDSGAEVYPEVLLEDVVFTDWKGKPDEDLALDKLAQLLVSKHHDRWLLEALRQPEAFRLLGEAIQADADSNYELVREKAEAAESLYAVKRNVAGRLRAQAEKAYALQSLANGPECLRSFDPNALDSIRESYPWLYGQLEMELAACNNLIVHVGAALAASERALDALQRAQYHSQELRAASFVAVYRGHLGDVRSLYRNSLHALGSWWEGPYGGALAQNLLLNLSAASDTSGHRFAAWAYRKEAAIEFQPEAPLPLLALATSRLASSAAWIDKVEEARLGYREADRLFALAPDSTTKRSYMANADKMRAEALGGSQPSTAVKILEDGPPMSFPLEEMRRAEMLGSLNGSLDRHKESEEAYARAVELAEKRAVEPDAGRRRAELLAESEHAYKGLVASLLRNHEDWTKSFEVWERFRSGVIGTGPARPSGETFLVFAILPGGVAVWVEDATALHGAWLAPLDGEHQTLIDTFARECSHDTTDPHWKITSRRLNDWLIAPVAQWLDRSTTVVIEADEALNRIPFAALIDAKGMFLGERFALVSSPNVSSYEARAGGARGLSASDPTLVLADPELRGDMRRAYPSLSEADVEAANIQQRFPNTRVFRKKDATVDALESYGIKSSLIHFAGHGIGNARNGGLLLSAIGEGQADILDTSRIEKQDWRRSQLVTLASCSAAREDASQGNSITLVRAFLAAGARRVMAARWNVDSAATADLMREFYGALGRGDAPSVALHNAASVIRSGRPHPYYWAAFEMFGYK